MIMSRIRRGLKYLLFGGLIFLCLPAFAWWNSDWSLRKKITLDTSSSGLEVAEPIGTSPVLIRLHDGNFRFTDAQENGSDIRLVAEDDKTLLSYHIEKYDSLLNEAFVWVKIPDIKPGNKTSFWLYYGNSSGKAAKVDSPKDTYDADTTLVYHFAERGQPAADSTKNGNNAQNAGTPVDGSIIGPGVRFDGQNGITIPASPSMTWTQGGVLTWSAWIKLTALQPNTWIYSRHDGGNAFVIGSDNGIPYVEVTNAGSTQRSQPRDAIPINAWRHLAVVEEGSKITLYVDGSVYSTLDVAIPALNGVSVIGADTASGGAGFAGEMDELNISKIVRPVGFIKLAAFGQGGDRASKLLATGEDEQTSSFISGYFGIILKSVTPDGWVVIGILMVMAMLSWFVMANRIHYLNQITRGNAKFLSEWHHVASDLTILDHPNAEKAKTLGGRINSSGKNVLRNSSIYRIYHLGAEEIQHRLRSGSKVLSGAAIASIRATMDGGLVRETQKLNRLMVFLTLSISGGPFLGLLGTVVGVMITFAAIAAAGDVNVNSIAPGIAAALVATVAGLAVAIPALFGYNYLITRIKNATSDMHVFIDEFVTKVAEFYCAPEGQGPEKEESPYASSVRR
jgi:biopolymer transport protein ExbB